MENCKVECVCAKVALSLLSFHWNVKHMEEERGGMVSPSMRKARHVLTGLPALSILSTQTHPLGYQISSLFVGIFVLCVHENASNDSLAAVYPLVLCAPSAYAEAL